VFIKDPSFDWKVGFVSFLLFTFIIMSTIDWSSVSCCMVKCISHYFVLHLLKLTLGSFGLITRLLKEIISFGEKCSPVKFISNWEWECEPIGNDGFSFSLNTICSLKIILCEIFLDHKNRSCSL
jgi:hypothetical protein